jgi:hypothetical protein
VIEPLLCPVVGADWLEFMLIVTPVHGSTGATVSFLQLKTNKTVQTKIEIIK